MTNPASRAAWTVLLLCACGGEPAAPAHPETEPTRSSSSSGGGGSSGSVAPSEEAEVVVHAVFDLPRVAEARTLSAITTDGARYFALPDRTPQLTELIPDAEHRTFTVRAGLTLQGAPSVGYDGEGLARGADGSFYAVTVETEPRVQRFGSDGVLLAEIPTPARFSRQAAGNKGLESLSLSPSGRYLFSCNETALLGDGGGPTKERGAKVRLLRIDLERNTSAELVYLTDPLGEGGERGADMGVSDVLALDDERLLVLERGFQPSFGNTVRVYQVSLAGLSDVSYVEALGDDDAPMPKRLLVDLETLDAGATTHPSVQPNPLLDNYEGLTLGPLLEGGRRALLLLADDNERDTQVPRVLVLGWRPAE